MEELEIQSLTLWKDGLTQTSSISTELGYPSKYLTPILGTDYSRILAGPDFVSMSTHPHGHPGHIGENICVALGSFL